MAELGITVKGMSAQLRRLTDAQKRVVDLSPVTKPFAEELRTIVSDSFQRQESPTGEVWPVLEDKTKEEKKKLGRSPLALIRSGKLSRSGVFQGKKTEIVFGIGADVTYGVFHQKLKGFASNDSIPRRAFLPIDESGTFEERGNAGRWLKRFRAAVAKFVTTGRV